MLLVPPTKLAVSSFPFSFLVSFLESLSLSWSWREASSTSDKIKRTEYSPSLICIREEALIETTAIWQIYIHARDTGIYNWRKKKTPEIVFVRDRSVTLIVCFPTTVRAPLRKKSLTNQYLFRPVHFNFKKISLITKKKNDSINPIMFDLKMCLVRILCPKNSYRYTPHFFLHCFAFFSLIKIENTNYKTIWVISHVEAFETRDQSQRFSDKTFYFFKFLYSSGPPAN